VFLGSKALPGRKADKCWQCHRRLWADCLENVGSSTSQAYRPQRLVKGIALLVLIIGFFCLNQYNYPDSGCDLRDLFFFFGIKFCWSLGWSCWIRPTSALSILSSFCRWLCNCGSTYKQSFNINCKRFSAGDYAVVLMAGLCCTTKRLLRLPLTD
jgi:hypothetical protein